MSLLDALLRRRHQNPLLECWPCDVCQDIRVDELIGVVSLDGAPPEYLTEVRVSVKFCKDRDVCRRLAPEMAQTRIDIWRTDRARAR